MDSLPPTEGLPIWVTALVSALTGLVGAAGTYLKFRSSARDDRQQALSEFTEIIKQLKDFSKFKDVIIEDQNFRITRLESDNETTKKRADDCERWREAAQPRLESLERQVRSIQSEKSTNNDDVEPMEGTHQDA